MFGLGIPELMIILVIGVVLFGSSKLPQLGSGLGRAIRDFRKEVTGNQNSVDESKKDERKNFTGQIDSVRKGG